MALATAATSWSGTVSRWQAAEKGAVVYYASQRPTDDHGVRPAVLVVFDDELAAGHFLRVARQEMERAGVDRAVDRRFLGFESQILPRQGISAPRLRPQWLIEHPIEDFHLDHPQRFADQCV